MVEGQRRIGGSDQHTKNPVYTGQRGRKIMLNNTNRVKRLKRTLATVMLCLLLGGCGPWIGDPVVDVIGQVTLDGKELTDAKVVFIPIRFRNEDGIINPLAFGKTDGTGRFELYSGDQKGVLLGKYRVLIFQMDALEADPLQAETIIGASVGSDSAKQDVAARELAKLFNEPVVSPTAGETLPAKYNSHSELEYVIDFPVGIVYPKFHLTSE